MAKGVPGRTERQRRQGQERVSIAIAIAVVRESRSQALANHSTYRKFLKQTARSSHPFIAEQAKSLVVLRRLPPCLSVLYSGKESVGMRGVTVAERGCSAAGKMERKRRKL